MGSITLTAGTMLKCHGATTYMEGSQGDGCTRCKEVEGTAKGDKGIMPRGTKRQAAGIKDAGNGRRNAKNTGIGRKERKISWEGWFRFIPSWSTPSWSTPSSSTVENYVIPIWSTFNKTLF